MSYERWLISMIRSLCKATFCEHYTLFSFLGYCGHLLLLWWLATGSWFIDKGFFGEKRTFFEDRFAALFLFFWRLLSAQTQLVWYFFADDQLLTAAIDIVGTSSIRVLVLCLFAFCILLDAVHFDWFTIANNHSIDTVTTHVFEFGPSSGWAGFHFLLNCLKRRSL